MSDGRRFAGEWYQGRWNASEGRTLSENRRRRTGLNPKRSADVDGNRELEWPSFWDVAYAHGDHRDYWEPPTTPTELVSMVADGVIAAGHTVLDMGCGSGVEAVYLARQGCRVIGVDASAPALACARTLAESNGVEVDWRRASVFDVPLDDHHVDVVIDRGCFHVIPRARRAAYAAEVARVLRPGGIVLLRGAAEDDEDAGVVGIDVARLDSLFPAPTFERAHARPLALVARSEVLAGRLVLLRKQG